MAMAMAITTQQAEQQLAELKKVADEKMKAEESAKKAKAEADGAVEGTVGTVVLLCSLPLAWVFVF